MTEIDLGKLATRLAEIVLSPDFNATDEADHILATCAKPDSMLIHWENESERQEHRADRWEREWETANAKLERLEALCSEAEAWNQSDKDTWFVLTPERVRAILQGGDAP